MPITQERMIEVLDEAEALRTMLLELRRSVLDALNIEAARYIINASPIPLCPALVAERNHFARSRARNEKNAQAMTAKRRKKRGLV